MWAKKGRRCCRLFSAYVVFGKNGAIVVNKGSEQKGCGREKLQNKADGAVVAGKGSGQSVALKNYKIRQTAQAERAEKNCESKPIRRGLYSFLKP